MQTAELTITQALREFKRQYQDKTGRIERTEFANCLTYSTDTGRCEEMAEEANELIAVFGLPLVAEATTFPTQDSFIVKRKS